MELAKLSWPAVGALPRDMPVVIPVAAVEQHGHHLPVFTDSFLLGEIVRRIHEQLDGRILLAPLMWLGNSHHHLDFPGTLSGEPRMWIDLVAGLIDNFIQHGFRRIVVLNGHGGNDVPGRQATFEIRQRYRERRDLLLLFATYWNLASPTDVISELHQAEMGHACEWETSMILRIAPELVGRHEEVAPVEPGNPFRPAHRAWITTDRSEPGHIGHPAAANAEKGERLFETFSAGAVELLERVIRWDGESWEG